MSNNKELMEIKTKTKTNIKNDTNEKLKKTQICNSVKDGKKCPYGDRCNFAHDRNELVIRACSYGSDCRLVFVSSEMEYLNKCEDGRVCMFLHTDETLDNYYTRTENVKHVEKKSAPRIKENDDKSRRTGTPLSASLFAELDFDDDDKEFDKIEKTEKIDKPVNFIVGLAPITNKVKKPEPIKPVSASMKSLEEVPVLSVSVPTAISMLDTKEDDNIIAITVPRDYLETVLELVVKTGKANVKIIVV